VVVVQSERDDALDTGSNSHAFDFLGICYDRLLGAVEGDTGAKGHVNRLCSSLLCLVSTKRYPQHFNFPQNLARALQRYDLKRVSLLTILLSPCVPRVKQSGIPLILLRPDLVRLLHECLGIQSRVI